MFKAGKLYEVICDIRNLYMKDHDIPRIKVGEILLLLSYDEDLNGFLFLTIEGQKFPVKFNHSTTIMETYIKLIEVEWPTHA